MTAAVIIIPMGTIQSKAVNKGDTTYSETLVIRVGTIEKEIHNIAAICGLYFLITAEYIMPKQSTTAITSKAKGVNLKAYLNPIKP